VNLQIPYELNGQLTADVTFNVNGVLSSVQNVDIGTVPAAFTTSQSGSGTAVLHTTDYTPVTPSNPAVAGEILAIFANGLGPLATPIADGALATTNDDATLIVTVSIGGQSSAVQYAGLAPGFVGLYQINTVMPTVPSGTNPLIINVNGIPSSGTATIPAQ
jgi:minor extracellular serine protease Vpr